MKSKITLPIEELPIPKLTRSTNEQMPAAPAPTPRRKGRPRSVSISESDTMKEINKEEIKILTVDPPIEITPKRRGRPKKVIV